MINQPPVQYKGEDLDADRGPGLGCFRFQVVILIFFVILTPLTVVWNWPTWASALLLFAVLALLLVAGQTVIFLLRLVAADRRSRRRPLASTSPTVGELEDAASSQVPAAPGSGESAVPGDARAEPESDPEVAPVDEGPVAQ